MNTEVVVPSARVISCHGGEWRPRQVPKVEMISRPARLITRFSPLTVRDLTSPKMALKSRCVMGRKRHLQSFSLCELLSEEKPQKLLCLPLLRLRHRRVLIPQTTPGIKMLVLTVPLRSRRPARRFTDRARKHGRRRKKVECSRRNVTSLQFFPWQQTCSLSEIRRVAVEGVEHEPCHFWAARF